MTQRLKTLPKPAADRVVREIEELSQRMVDVARIIGPCFGAPWTDKALKLHRGIAQLRIQVQDECWRRGIDLDELVFPTLAEATERARKARAELEEPDGGCVGQPS